METEDSKVLNNISFYNHPCTSKDSEFLRVSAEGLLILKNDLFLDWCFLLLEFAAFGPGVTEFVSARISLWIWCCDMKRSVSFCIKYLNVYRAMIFFFIFTIKAWFIVARWWKFFQSWEKSVRASKNRTSGSRSPYLSSEGTDVLRCDMKMQCLLF